MNILNKKAMTLFELLAVIVILGIVALIAVPTIGNVINNAKKDTFASQANTFVQAAISEAEYQYLTNGKITNTVGIDDGVDNTETFTLTDLQDLGRLSSDFETKDPYNGTFKGKVTITITEDNEKIIISVTNVSFDNGEWGLAGQPVVKEKFTKTDVSNEGITYLE